MNINLHEKNYSPIKLVKIRFVAGDNCGNAPDFGILHHICTIHLVHHVCNIRFYNNNNNNNNIDIFFFSFVEETGKTILAYSIP